MPLRLVDSKGQILQLINTMCDLTQFIVSIVIKEAPSENLAIFFTENNVLSFGMVAVVVVDSKILSLFEEICKTLEIIFWPLSRGCHIGISVERYYRFQNKM